MRPPRAWCLAVRASDTRLAKCATISPAPPADSHADQESVTLSAAAMTVLCAPVHLEPGKTLDEAAEKLGTTPMGLRNARLNGVFRVRHVAGLLGRRGRPVPLLSCDRPLDPAARNFAEPDPAWIWTASYLPTRIPPDFEQTLTRVALYRSHVPRHFYDEYAHPELDGVGPIAKPRRQLPPPEPDNAWYKWSLTGGHFLGDDPSNWRKHPYDDGDRQPRWLTKRKQKPRPRPSASTGSHHFNGYQWLCPACGKTCRTIYLPLPRLNLLDPSDPLCPSPVRLSPEPPLAGVPLALSRAIDIPAILPLPAGERAGVRGQRKESSGVLPLPSRERAGVRGERMESIGAPPPSDPPTFACARCHRVKFFSRVQNEAWNDLIAYLTAGLLYGREVPRPGWFTKDRKRPYKPMINARPAARRAEVEQLLLAGLTRPQIVAALSSTKTAVDQHCWKIFRQHGVRTQRALLKRRGRPLPTPMLPRRTQVLHHLDRGESQYKNPFCLRFAFANEVGWSLQLRHRHLSSPASLLWGFPSRGVGQVGWRNSLRTAVSDLSAAGIPTLDIDAYGADLEGAEFERSGGENWHTVTAGLDDGMDRIFRFPANRNALVAALRRFVERVEALS